ncbi:hypothetical protein [Mucilaginibacter auburnensis]|uniref:Outer membrane protein with beta-barrel domain n=1 Tax=Mucilaginibacter auburnensis TaxID=1457233 RepID=A0A2H9VM22_9SPHI|nr:hypothetical protein [Mucilaginibacter auburnensis]PJJ79366.1 hypothetical protein CLV57_2498 [Mucilaginibacter auburnensis]
MYKLTSTIALATALGAVTMSASAQDTKKEFAGTMQIQGMYREAKLGQLNGILNANGIPSLPDNNYWLNLSMNHEYKKLIIEDGIGASFTSTSGNNPVNGVHAKYNQFQIYGRAGYNVSTRENMRVFPFVGLNLSQAMLRIRDDRRMQSTSDFSSEILNSTSSKTLWNPRFGLEFGGGFDYLIRAKDKQMDNYTIKRYIPIGVRIGYYLQTSDSNWKVEGNHNLNNRPNNKQSNVFVNVNIGLGYKVKKP